MAQIGEGAAKCLSEKKDSKMPRDERTYQETLPEKVKRHRSKRENTKGRADRKERNKAPKATTNKSKKDADLPKKVDDSRNKNHMTECSSQKTEDYRNFRTEGKNDGSRKSNTNSTPNVVNKSSLPKGQPSLKRYNGIPSTPESPTVAVKNGEGGDFHDDKQTLQQDRVVKDLSNCNLFDATAFFNDLIYEDKLMLLTNYIEVMKKRSEKHPSAIFHCTLCKFHCNNTNHCRNHIKTKDHQSELKERKIQESIRLVPPPNKDHIQALDNVVMEAVKRFGMIDTERDICIDAAEEVSAFVAENFPGCSLSLYGSVASNIALKESNIDLNLQTPANLNGPTTLGDICKAISESSLFRNVTKDFDEGRPSIHFIHDRTKVKCSMCLSKDESLKTTEIILKYQSIDPRVRQLAVVFRKWAKLCEIDNYKNGMWPPHTFPLLLIYYLQQCEPPVLPVLHLLSGDPEDDTYLDPSELEGKWKKHNRMSVGELWLGLLRFYAVDYQHSERVVTIRRKSPLKRTEKNWIGKRTAIEEPFCVKRNVSRTIIHNCSFKYIMNCFRWTYLYYAIPRTVDGPMYAFIQPTFSRLEADPMNLARKEEMSAYCKTKMLVSKYFLGDDCSAVKKRKGRSLSRDNSTGSNEQTVVDEGNVEQVNSEEYIICEELSESDALFVNSRLKKEIIKFKFSAKTGDKSPPIICTICAMDGHSKAVCPEAKLPPLPTLPAMTNEYCALLDEFCSFIFERYSQKPYDLKIRVDILAQLEEFIRGSYPDVQLAMFGSSANGFGFRNSDLDICLTFKNNSTGEGIDVTKLITKLVSRLRKMPTIRNIVPIPSAKVPIIKFKDINTHLEGDISLYNTLAQHNTQLLKTYSCIDNRVKILGFVMKAFAKQCDICDASRGSLSSYAYILMVIYFLQQCDPPVVPVLQEITDVQPKPVYKQEGQDVWFFNDLNKLKQIWPEYGKNSCSVGALWLQLLRFYTEDFNFEECVVSIRQKRMVYKFEKMWCKKPMAIEDPFDVNHNLGGALSRKMKLFIIKSMRKGRFHFGNPISKLPPAFKSWEDYFLNVSSLREGAPPNNGCHICKKIGHKVRNCPERMNGQKEKRPDEHNKNMHGFLPQQQDQKKRPPMNFVNSQNFWAKGAVLVKNDKRHPHIPPFTQQQIQPMWNQQQWFHMQRPHGNPVMWAPGAMPGRQPPLQFAPMVPPPMPPPHDIRMQNCKMSPNNYIFRHADMQGQVFHDPCMPLSNYRRHMDSGASMKKPPGEPHAVLGGAIPKVGPINLHMPNYRELEVANDSNVLKQ